MESKTATIDEEPHPRTYFKGRMVELDSLRGLAAVTVVLHHLVMGWLSFLHPSGWNLVLLRVFYPLYAGPEAVRLFFVLSGMVLAISFGYGPKRQAWKPFVLRRIARIYFPYLVAFALAVLGASIWHGPIEHSLVKNCCWSDPVNSKLVLQHILFLGDYDFGQFNPVIWSLVHEMRISLVFPLLFFLVERLTTRGAFLLAAGCTLSSMAILRFLPGQISPILPMSEAMTLHFVALFIFGILLARNLERISSWYATLHPKRRYGLLFGAFLIYSFTAVISAAAFGSHIKLTIGLSDWGTALGAAGIIVTVHCSRSIREMMHGRVAVFLGRISFSLYLVHIPVLLLLVFIMQRIASIRASTIIPIYLVASVAVAYLFCLFVEEPFAGLGRRLGQLADRPHLDKHRIGSPLHEAEGLLPEIVSRR